MVSSNYKELYQRGRPNTDGYISKANANALFFHSTLDNAVIEEIWIAAVGNTTSHMIDEKRFYTALRLISQAQCDLPSDEVIEGDLPEAQFDALPLGSSIPSPQTPRKSGPSPAVPSTPTNNKGHTKSQSVPYTTTASSSSSKKQTARANHTTTTYRNVSRREIRVGAGVIDDAHMLHDNQNSAHATHASNMMASSGPMQTVFDEQNVVIETKEWEVTEQLNVNYNVNFDHLSHGKSYVKIDDPSTQALFSRSKLPAETLHKVFRLCDIDKDKHFDREEFVMALHMCRVITHHPGCTVPSILPTVIIPQTKRKEILARHHKRLASLGNSQSLSPISDIDTRNSELDLSSDSTKNKIVGYHENEPSQPLTSSSILFNALSAEEKASTLHGRRHCSEGIVNVTSMSKTESYMDSLTPISATSTKSDHTEAHTENPDSAVNDLFGVHIGRATADPSKDSETYTSMSSSGLSPTRQPLESENVNDPTRVVSATSEQHRIKHSEKDSSVSSSQHEEEADCTDGRKKKSRFRSMLNSIGASDNAKRANMEPNTAVDVSHHSKTPMEEHTLSNQFKKAASKTQKRSQSHGGLLVGIDETDIKHESSDVVEYEGTPLNMKSAKKSASTVDNILDKTTNLFKRRQSKNVLSDNLKDSSCVEKELLNTQSALLVELKEAERMLQLEVAEKAKLEVCLANAVSARTSHTKESHS
eukprot:CFRG0132T1